MKLIIAIVRPFKVAEIVDAIDSESGFPGVTVLDGRGFGRGKKAPHTHRPGEDIVDFTGCSILLVAAQDTAAGAIAATLERVSHTGRSGDGKVLVVPLESAIRIATGETGDTAL